MRASTVQSVLFQRLLEHLKEIAVDKKVTIKDVDAFCGYWQSEMELAEGLIIGDNVYDVERLGTLLMVEVNDLEGNMLYSFEYDLLSNEYYPEIELSVEDLIVIKSYSNQLSI